MHPLDALAADPDRLAEIEEAAERASRAVTTSSVGYAVVDEAAVRHLGGLLPPGLDPAVGEPETRDGQRLWRLVDGFGRFLEGIYERGRGPVAPTFDEYDRAVEAARGGWFRIREEAYDAFRDLVRSELAPPEARAQGRAFWDALQRRDLDAVRAVLQDGTDLRALPTYGHGPPVYTALRWHYHGRRWNDADAMVRLLVAHGACANPFHQEFADGAVDTPLELARRHKDAGMAVLIRQLSARAEPLNGPALPPGWVEDRAAPEADAVLVAGKDRDSGVTLRVRTSTGEELRAGLAALGVTRVEMRAVIAVDSHGAVAEESYSLADVPDTLLGQVRSSHTFTPSGGYVTVELTFTTGI
jgi:hypothetical protein